MATLDVTEKVNVLVDAIGWEGFCEELMARMDEDALDAVCDRIAPRYGVELAGRLTFRVKSRFEAMIRRLLRLSTI